MSTNPADKDRDGLVVGVDVGGTKIRALVVDGRGHVLGVSKQGTPAGLGALAILETIAECVEEVCAESGAGGNQPRVMGVGVGIPGTVDVGTGRVLVAPNLGLKDVGLGEWLSGRLMLPTVVVNDVHAGGYAEWRLGAGYGAEDLLCVFVGTGVGGCLILHNAVHLGVTGNAGEIGHLAVKLGGRRCGCGRRGCLETVASRSAIARRVAKAVARGTRSVLSSRLSRPDKPRTGGGGGELGAVAGSGGADMRWQRIKSRDLAAALGVGDELVVRETKRAARYLGRTLGGLVNLLAPERIILGGGLASALGDEYLAWVTDAARRQAWSDPQHKVRFLLSRLGDDAGPQGAALIAREYLRSHHLANPEIPPVPHDNAGGQPTPALHRLAFLPLAVFPKSHPRAGDENLEVRGE